MPTTISREERVMFDDVLEGFEDGLVISKAAEKYEPLNPAEMNRVGDKFWVPAPGIAVSYDGFDQTANFGDITELSVPVSIGFHKSTPVKMTAKDLRTPTTLKRKGDEAKHKLASDINYALFMTVALQGSQVIKRTVAPTGFDDVALADAQLTEQGIGLANRYMFLAPRVYNSMAGNLAKPQTSGLRETMTAYERARVSDDIAGFSVYKNDQSFRLAAATGGATTVNGANQYWVPKSFSVAVTGETENVDNRYSQLAVTAATYANIKAGDAFTIAGVNSVHMITKQDTGQLQTFRVIGKPSAGVILVAPAIISGQGGTRPELEFKNVTATPATGAALTWLNTATAELNPFFKKESLLLLPGSFQVDPQDGWQVLRGTTENGIKITYTRQGEINDLSVKARWDVDFGTSLLNPMMAGVELFNQT
ncbi:MAG TPA: P22 phage major capsid protein family protein [Acidovorax sp.]|nr:P22 phage major capsid protein family protein [Acidovorax sp.]